MASYLNISESFLWKAILSLINFGLLILSSIKLAFTTSPTGVDTLSVLPDEILTEILALTLASDVPLHLQDFIEVGERKPFKATPGPEWFLHQLVWSQEDHYRDWLTVNGVSRRFRACGKLAFFMEKIFIISPPLLKALHDGSRRNISAADRLALFSHARHVIVAWESINVVTQFTELPTYNAFKGIRVLSIQPFVRHPDDLPLLPLKIASTPTTSQPLQPDDCESPGFGTPKRHSAPQELLSLLEGAGLQVERMEVDLIHRDTAISRTHVLDVLTNNVYPYLWFIGRQKAEKRKAEKRRAEGRQPSGSP